MSLSTVTLARKHNRFHICFISFQVFRWRDLSVASVRDQRLRTLVCSSSKNAQRIDRLTLTTIRKLPSHVGSMLHKRTTWPVRYDMPTLSCHRFVVSLP